MAEEPLVTCHGVSKKFCRSLKRSLWYGVADMAAQVAGAGTRHDHLRKDEFWAVDDVSFELRRGECLGLIGHNGAGKTTLLRMLNGLIKPDRGRIEMRGRVGALIALGAGFNPILTGRENIYINGSVLGLSKKEIDKSVDDIIDFAELKEFIDTPVLHYSSGMTVRLGFGVATTIKPDVLILDEVLAVGDAAFRAQCYHRLGQLHQHAAVIFVSHAVEQVSRICSSVMLLDSGSVAYHGDTAGGCEAYTRAIGQASSCNDTFTQMRDPIVSATCKWNCDQVEFGGNLEFSLVLESSAPIPNASVRHAFYNSSGEAVAEWTNFYAGDRIDLSSGSNRIDGVISSIQLKPGPYDISTFVSDTKGLIVNYWTHKTKKLTVLGTTYGICHYQMK